MRYGRAEDEWAQLAAVGKQFLIERARLRLTTTYTEFNAVLGNRAHTTGFNFELDADRAAVGALLSQISEDALPGTGGLLISALVQYLDANDAGPGFYALARSKGFSVPPKTDDRQLFWAGHVSHLHQHFARHVTDRQR